MYIAAGDLEAIGDEAMSCQIRTMPEIGASSPNGLSLAHGPTMGGYNGQKTMAFRNVRGALRHAGGGAEQCAQCQDGAATGRRRHGREQAAFHPIFGDRL